MGRPRPGTLASRLDGGVRTVLVVEDEPDIATFLGAFFRASGTNVVHIDPTTPDEVVAKAVELGAVCALVDLNLSGITGFDVMLALQADERVAALPVLIVSADARPAVQQRAAELGAVGFVPKPFNVKDLFSTVTTLLEAGEAAEDVSGEPTTGVDLIGPDALHGRLNEVLASARAAQTPVTLALLRLQGTPASPALLAELARNLVPGLPRVEVLGATGADELAVLVEGHEAEAVAEALEAAFPSGQVELDLGGRRMVRVAVRGGVATAPKDAHTAEELYMAADIALADAVEGDAAVVVAG